MSAEILKQVVNFDNLATKRKFMQGVQGLTGLWEVSLKPRKFTRSLSQNAYYFAAVVTPFTEWLRQEWGDSSVTVEQAHELLKHKILGTKELMNKETGEVIEITRSSRMLDSAEFGEFIDKAAAWLAEFTGIVVLSSDLFWESAPQEKRKAS
jgi:hypothetical protein